MYISNVSFVPAGGVRKHLDLSAGDSNDNPFRPALLENSPITSLSSMQYKRGTRFLSAPGTFDLSTRALIIDNFIAANAPVFVHHKLTYLPVDVSQYLQQASLISNADETVTPVLDDYLRDPRYSNDWALNWTPPASTATTTPVVYVRVLRSTQVMMTGFTDVEYSVFYPPLKDVHGNLMRSVNGWVKVAVRLDNDTGAVDSVLFNGTKRM